MQLGLAVVDPNEFYREYVKAGLKFTSEPTVIYGTRVARFLDPDGAEIAVNER
ncbi:MAG: hypothetical protein NVS3B5_11630 [Sphingomicrobium sp.]